MSIICFKFKNSILLVKNCIYLKVLLWDLIRNNNNYD